MLVVIVLEVRCKHSAGGKNEATVLVGKGTERKSWKEGERKGLVSLQLYRSCAI